MKAKPLISEPGNTIEVGVIIGYHIYCEGCKETHFIYTNPKFCSNGGWDFNGDTENPTFTPSLLVYGNDEIGRPRCHSIITNGKMAYCSDCTHELANQIVELIDVE